MKSFTGFLNEADARSIEPIELKVSPKLTDILKKISSNNVAKRILDNIGNKVSDVSFLSISENDSKNVTYLPSNRIDKVEGDPYTSRLRQPMNWGKLINNLFPGEFTNMDIDNFYNRYRPEIDSKDTEDKRFVIMRGDDIRKWYHHSMYNGEMGSCMRYDKCQDYFKMYTENPEKVGLLVYLDETGNKAYGRALVWDHLLKPSGDTKENKDPYTLLDRIYTVSGKSQLPALYKKYAIDHGWIYKDNDGFYMDGVRKTSSVTIKLKPKDYGKYPYMDTMQYYTPMTGRASSTAGNPARDPNNPTKVFPRYNLRSQDGGYGKID